MSTTNLAPVFAVLLAASPALAQNQLSDRSGPITFTLNAAPYVEVVNHDPSFHNLTESADQYGGERPGNAISTHTLLQYNPPWREVRANTPYRISIVGLRADGKLVFTNQHGDALVLTTTCDLLATADPATRNLSTMFDCRGSPVYPDAESRWVLFHAYTPLRTDTDNARAGVYTAVVYVQIDAA